MNDNAHKKETSLPPVFKNWFEHRGWVPRDHQLACIVAANGGHSHLLIAPTGGGKTLAGFLPSLITIADRKTPDQGRLHTLYISPLKALAVDIARNLDDPIKQMQLDVQVETRTGDTPPARRQRQKHQPPDILLTTPESLSLLIAAPDAAIYFKGLKRIILDELHALVPNCLLYTSPSPRDS